MTIHNEFEIGQEVFVKTDPDQYVRQVTGILVTPGGVLQYRVAIDSSVSWFYNFELSENKHLNF